MSVRVVTPDVLYEKLKDRCGNCHHERRHHTRSDYHQAEEMCYVCLYENACYKFYEPTPMQIAEWVEQYYERMAPWTE